MAAATVAHAAISVLCRTDRDELEIFWVRRNPKLTFLGGFWAFPGGRVEPGDADLVATAARELEEETGVGLGSAGERWRFVDAGRTVTPSWANIRFDARYFLVEAPPGARPDVSRSGGELVEGEWLTPARALERWSSGERLTSPVVVEAMRALVAGGWDGAAQRLRDRLRALEGDERRAFDLVPGLALAMLRSPTIPPATHTNCFIAGDTDLIVVDPGSPYPEEIAALDESLEAMAAVGRRPREIWITHHHIDHVAGVPHLVERWGVTVAAHPATAERLRGLCKVDRELVDGEAVSLGTRTLRVVFTPGHTPGHHAFVEETTGLVMAGDLVAGVGTVIVDPDEGDMVDYLASIARVKSIAPRALLPAHGPILTEAADKLDEYTRHRLWREARVFDAVVAAGAGGATARQLVPVAYADVPPEVHPLAERSLLAHLAKLVREGRVVVEGSGDGPPAYRFPG